MAEFVNEATLKEEQEEVQLEVRPGPNAAPIICRTKLQNTGPLIYISLNHKGANCVILRSSKDFDACQTGEVVLYSVIAVAEPNSIKMTKG